MSIELLDYQEEAINNIFGDEKTVGLFERGKRSAAVVLPTGGGKSFVAMRTIEEMMKKFPIEPTGEYPKAINTGICFRDTK